MKFALVNNQRQEAQPSLEGICLVCGSPMVARCGVIRIRHWAHGRSTQCDPWWERETEWHRNWKNQFPNDWQEVVQHAVDGEKHIADIKTQAGWVIEFQHSSITPEERQSRETFYEKLIWVVNGNRRIRDKDKFFKILGNRKGRWVKDGKFPELQITLPEGPLYRDWITSQSHVFFDFGGEDLWLLLPQSDKSWAFILPIARSEFIELHSEDKSSRIDRFESLINKYNITHP